MEFLKQIWDLVQNPVVLTPLVGVIGALIGVKIPLVIDKIAKKGKVVSVEAAESLSALGDVFGAIDKMINDDGSINENSISDVIASGKEASAQFKDVIVSIKPTKTTTTE